MGARSLKLRAWSGEEEAKTGNPDLTPLYLGCFPQRSTATSRLYRPCRSHPVAPLYLGCFPQRSTATSRLYRPCRSHPVAPFPEGEAEVLPRGVGRYEPHWRLDWHC